MSKKIFQKKRQLGDLICKSTVMNVVDGWWRCHGQLCFISQKGICKICQICQIGSSLTVSDRLWGILRNKILKRTVTELCQMSSLSEYMFRISKKIKHILVAPCVHTYEEMHLQCIVPLSSAVSYFSVGDSISQVIGHYFACFDDSFFTQNVVWGKSFNITIS